MTKTTKTNANSTVDNPLAQSWKGAGIGGWQMDGLLARTTATQREKTEREELLPGSS